MLVSLLICLKNDFPRLVGGSGTAMAVGSGKALSAVLGGKSDAVLEVAHN